MNATFVNSSTSTPAKQRPPSDTSPSPAQSVIETPAAANPTLAANVPPVPSPAPELAAIPDPRAPRDATASPAPTERTALKLAKQLRNFQGCTHEQHCEAVQVTNGGQAQQRRTPKRATTTLSRCHGYAPPVNWLRDIEWRATSPLVAVLSLASRTLIVAVSWVSSAPLPLDHVVSWIALGDSGTTIPKKAIHDTTW